MSDTVLVGNMDVFVRGIEELTGTAMPRASSPVAGFFMGIPVKTDVRVPDGVWAIVPAGKNLLDEGVEVGAVTEEYRSAAQAFATVLHWARNVSATPVIQHAPNDGADKC